MNATARDRTTPPRRAVAIMAVGLAVLGASCAAPQRRTAPASRALAIRHQVDGALRAVQRCGEHCLATVGGDLLVLDPTSGVVQQRLPLGEPGRIAAAADMIAMDAHRVAVILVDQAIVEVELDDAGVAARGRRRDAGSLGIRPRRFSRADGTIYVSGPGGVIRYVDGTVVFPHAGDPGPVAIVGDRLATTVGRRIYDLGTGEYRGSASALLNAGNLLVFRRDGEVSAVGLMGPDAREIDVERATARIEEPIGRVRVLDDVIWVTTESSLRRYRIQRRALVELPPIDLAHARDVARVGEGELMVVGGFGRCLLRRGAADTWYAGNMIPAPGHLTRAEFDGRILAAGDERTRWQYPVGGTARLVPGTAADLPIEAPVQVAAIGARALAEDRGRMLRIDCPDGAWRLTLPQAVTVECLAALDGDVWIGHQRGITVVRPSGDGSSASVVGTIRTAGPVDRLWPLLNGSGVVYVSRDGGMGVVGWTNGGQPVIEPDLAGRVAAAGRGDP